MDAKNLPPGFTFVRNLFEDNENVLLVKKESKLLVLKRLLKTEELIQKSQIKEIAKLFLDKPSSFITQLYDIFELKNITYITMEYLEGPTLRELIVEHHNFSEDAAVFYSACIFTALKHIHSLNVVHKDVVSQNVVTDRSGYAKLIDFESSKLYENIYPHVFIDYTGLGDIIKEMLIGEDIRYQHLSVIRGKLSNVSYSFLKLMSLIEKCYLSWNWMTCPTDISSHRFYRVCSLHRKKSFGSTSRIEKSNLQQFKPHNQTEIIKTSKEGRCHKFRKGRN